MKKIQAHILKIKKWNQKLDTVLQILNEIKQATIKSNEDSGKD